MVNLKILIVHIYISGTVLLLACSRINMRFWSYVWLGPFDSLWKKDALITEVCANFWLLESWSDDKDDNHLGYVAASVSESSIYIARRRLTSVLVSLQHYRNHSESQLLGCREAILDTKHISTFSEWMCWYWNLPLPNDRCTQRGRLLRSFHLQRVCKRVTSRVFCLHPILRA